MPASGSGSIRSSGRSTSPAASTRTATSSTTCSSAGHSTGRAEVNSALLRSSIAGRYDAFGFRHQDDGALGCARAVYHALRYHESLEPLQIDAAILEIDDEVAI